MAGIAFHADSGFSLDAWIRCDGAGCEWDVPISARRCVDHGGPAGPSRMTSAWGDTAYRPTVIVFSDGDAEASPPWGDVA